MFASKRFRACRSATATRFSGSGARTLTTGRTLHKPLSQEPVCQRRPQSKSTLQRSAARSMRAVPFESSSRRWSAASKEACSTIAPSDQRRPSCRAPSGTPIGVGTPERVWYQKELVTTPPSTECTADPCEPSARL